MANQASRYISNLTRDTYALILAGGRGSRLYELTNWRAKPALYFGGKFRIIDFPLSNCINSGIVLLGGACCFCHNDVHALCCLLFCFGFGFGLSKTVSSAPTD